MFHESIKHMRFKPFRLQADSPAAHSSATAGKWPWARSTKGAWKRI